MFRCFCSDLENMEKEEEERAKAEAKIDPRDRTWSGMVVNDNSNSTLGSVNDTRPRYSDYRDSVVAIVTDVVRFKAQLPIGQVETRSNEMGEQIGTRMKHEEKTQIPATSEGTKSSTRQDKKSLLITAL